MVSTRDNTGDTDLNPASWWLLYSVISLLNDFMASSLLLTSSTPYHCHLIAVETGSGVKGSVVSDRQMRADRRTECDTPGKREILPTQGCCSASQVAKSFKKATAQDPGESE